MNPFAKIFFPWGTPDCVQQIPSLLHGSDSEPELPTIKPSSVPFPGPTTGIGQLLGQVGPENAHFSLLLPRDLNKNCLQAFQEVSPRNPSHQATMNYVSTTTTLRSPQEWTSATATPLCQQNFNPTSSTTTTAIPLGRSRAVSLGPFNLKPNHPSLQPVFASLNKHWALVPPTM